MPKKHTQKIQKLLELLSLGTQQEKRGKRMTQVRGSESTVTFYFF